MVCEVDVPVPLERLDRPLQRRGTGPGTSPSGMWELPLPPWGTWTSSLTHVTFWMTTSWIVTEGTSRDGPFRGTADGTRASRPLSGRSRRGGRHQPRPAQLLRDGPAPRAV